MVRCEAHDLVAHGTALLSLSSQSANFESRRDLVYKLVFGNDIVVDDIKCFFDEIAILSDYILRDFANLEHLGDMVVDLGIAPLTLVLKSNQSFFEAVIDVLAFQPAVELLLLGKLVVHHIDFALIDKSDALASNVGEQVLTLPIFALEQINKHVYASTTHSLSTETFSKFEILPWVLLRNFLTFEHINNLLVNEFEASSIDLLRLIELCK